MHFMQKMLSIFTFFNILNHSPVQDLSNKKRSFLRLLWASIFLRQFTKFWQTRYILCAPTVYGQIVERPDHKGLFTFSQYTEFLPHRGFELMFSRGGTTWTGDFKCWEVKTGFCRKRWMQTGFSGTLIGWKSGQTTYSLYGTEWRERGYGLRSGVRRSN